MISERLSFTMIFPSFWENKNKHMRFFSFIDIELKHNSSTMSGVRDGVFSPLNVIYCCFTLKTQYPTWNVFQFCSDKKMIFYVIILCLYFVLCEKFNSLMLFVIYLNVILKFIWMQIRLLYEIWQKTAV